MHSIMETFFENIIIKDVIFFLKGFLAGFIISIPLGPASIVCLRTTIKKGYFIGLLSGLGIALADTVYGTLSVLGLSSFADFLFKWAAKINDIAGCCLMLIGIYIAFKPSKPSNAIENDNSYSATILSTFAMTLANPFVLLLFTAVFSAIGLEDVQHTFDVVSCLIVGICAGSVVWWCGITFIFSRLTNDNQHRTLQWTNKIAGLVIFIFGLIALFL